MKIKSILTLFAVAVCAAACEKKEQGVMPSSADFAGTYRGYAQASSNYFTDKISAGETVLISQQDDGSASVSFASAAWGEFTVTKVQTSMSGGVCTLSGSGKAQMGMHGKSGTYDCTFSAEIRSKDEARMEFSIPAVMGGMSIVFRTGEAPADLLLTGTYKGYTDADCSYFQNRYTDGESVTLTANGNGTLKVVFESASWGTFTVESATATKEGEEYVLTGSGSVAMGMGDSTSNYDFTLSGRTNAAKDDFSIAFNVPAVMGGLTVTLLPGTAPTTEE